MQSADGLTDNQEDYVFAKNDVVYAIYLPKIKETMLNFFGSENTFSVQWYNPRTGGMLTSGSVKTVKGGSEVSIGFPQNKDKDWVALLTSENQKTAKLENLESQVFTLDALSDFHIDKKENQATFYRDILNGFLAIDSSNKGHRSKFALASTKFEGQSGLYNLSFVSMAENDGESEYIILKNGCALDTIINPQVDDDFKTIRHELDKFYIHKNDIIQIASKVVTNGKIPENDETAWSRGRWNALILIPEGLSIKEQLKNIKPFEEKDGFLEVEAEAFHYKSNNGTKRDWFMLPNGDATDISNSASNKKYIQALPNRRITHDDPLIHGENFFPVSGTGGVISYKIKINNLEKYYIWVNALSTGTEDNGVHVGFNENWQESGARVQWCADKNQWAWSSAQRVPENHCGTPKTIYLDIDTAGEHIISFSMREDGLKIDRFIIVNSRNFSPN